MRVLYFPFYSLLQELGPAGSGATKVATAKLLSVPKAGYT